jgi:hypothetical protein
MKSDDLYSLIESQIKVSKGDIVIAKTYILNNFQENALDLLRSFLSKMDVEELEKFVILESVDPQPQI